MKIQGCSPAWSALTFQRDIKLLRRAFSHVSLKLKSRVSVLPSFFEVALSMSKTFKTSQPDLGKLCLRMVGVMVVLRKHHSDMLRTSVEHV